MKTDKNIINRKEITLSKEMFAEVMGVEEFEFIEDCPKNEISWKESQGQESESINVSELSFMYKDWINIKYGFLLYSVPDLCIVKSASLEYIFDVACSTELESIFKASERVYENYPKRIIV